MKIVNETELMANQKASTTITPDIEFEAIETSAGNSVLFSIGYDDVSKTNKFWCTYEVPGDTHGWTRVDMASFLSDRDFQGVAIVPKSFDLGQDLSKGTIYLALVVTVGGKDYLYIAYNVQDSNLAGIPAVLTKFAFDDQNNMEYAGKPINDVFVTNMNGSMYVFADVNTQDATNTLTRYAVDQSNTVMFDFTQGLISQAWIPHGMAMDAQAGAISNAVGCGLDDASTGGIYTLCNIADIPALQYTGLFNSDEPGGAAFPVNFQLPAGTDATYRAIAVSAAAQAPYTDLFFATNTTVNGVPTGALYFIAYSDQIAKQDDSKTPPQQVLPQFQQVLTHDLLYNIQSLHVDNWNDNIVLWGQSQYTDPVTGTVSSQLFVTECVRGNETNAAAWSVPIPLLFSLENSATYINNTYSLNSSIDRENGNAYGSCSVIFAHQSDGSLVKLFQDPVTSAWQERFLLTEPVDAITVLYETTSYTSHIRITDDNNMVQPFIPVSIWSSSPCSVYVNNTYSNLEFTAPLQTTADESGIVNIMQPVDTIGGIAYHVAVQDPATKQWYTETINPFTATTANIKTQVPDGTNNHLSGDVQDEMGKSTLLAPNADAGQQLATSKNIYTMYTHADQANLNQDGLTTDQEAAGGWPTPGVSTVPSIQAAVAVQKPKAKADRLGKHMKFNPATDKIWGTSFGKNAKHYEGVEALKELGLTVAADGSMSLTVSTGQTLGSSDWFESKAGHLFKWMKSEAHKLDTIIVQLGTDGLDCLMTIAGDIYHFVVKCVNDVVNAIHTALNAIATAFEDLVKWIGSIFAWSDFISTHSVIKNLFVRYSEYAIKSIDNYKTAITGFGDKVIAEMDGWANIPSEGPKSQSADPANNTNSGQHSPQSNWGHHHMKNNASNASVSLSASDCSGTLQTLMTAIENEGTIFTETVEQLGDIFENIENLTVLELLQQVSVTFATGILLSIENVLIAFLNLVETAVQGIMDDMQNNTLKIPVISTLYERFVGSPLTLLDLMCLLCSIPTTVMYKLANKGTAPFPADDQDTKDLAGALDFESLSALCVDNPTQAALQAAGLLGDAPFNPQLNNKWYKLFFAGNVMALVGGLAMSLFTGLKSTDPALNDSKVIGWLSCAFYMPYIGPDIVGNIPGIAYTSGTDIWYGIMNAACAGLGLLKSLYDAVVTGSPQNNNGEAPDPSDPGILKSGKSGYAFVGPVLDALLGFAWEFPVVFAYINSNHWKNDIIDIAANTAFNVTGPLSLVINFAKGPAQFVGVCSSIVLNGAYGILSIAESLDGQPIDPIIIA